MQLPGPTGSWTVPAAFHSPSCVSQHLGTSGVSSVSWLAPPVSGLHSQAYKARVCPALRLKKQAGVSNREPMI